MRSFDILNNGDGNSSTKAQIKLTSASQRASSVNPVKQINSFNIKTKQEFFVKRFDASSIMFTVRW